MKEYPHECQDSKTPSRTLITWRWWCYPFQLAVVLMLWLFGLLFTGKKQPLSILIKRCFPRVSVIFFHAGLMLNPRGSRKASNLWPFSRLIKIVHLTGCTESQFKKMETHHFWTGCYVELHYTVNLNYHAFFWTCKGWICPLWRNCILFTWNKLGTTG